MLTALCSLLVFVPPNAVVHVFHLHFGLSVAALLVSSHSCLVVEAPPYNALFSNRVVRLHSFASWEERAWAPPVVSPRVLQCRRSGGCSYVSLRRLPLCASVVSLRVTCCPPFLPRLRLSWLSPVTHGPSVAHRKVTGGRRPCAIFRMAPVLPVTSVHNFCAKSQMLVNGRFRNWVFTLNNPEHDLTPDVDFVGSAVSFMAWQLEIGAEGTVHFQGYLELSSPCSLSQVQSLGGGLLLGAHFEVRFILRQKYFGRVRPCMCPSRVPAVFAACVPLFFRP